MPAYITTMQEEIKNLKFRLKSVTEELDIYAKDIAILKNSAPQGYIDYDNLLK